MQKWFWNDGNNKSGKNVKFDVLKNNANYKFSREAWCVS